MSGPAILVLGPGGLAVAGRIAAALEGSDVHGPSALADGAAVRFDDFGAHVTGLFRAGRPIVGLCASGILIRLLAPLLDDKRREPPVVAVAEDGSAVVPLLGGHRGGNRLAETIAEALGTSAAVTTAGDLRFGVGLDDPPPGWRLANPEDMKAFSARLLAGARVRIDGAAPWLTDSRLPAGPDAELEIVAGDAQCEGHEGRLVYNRQTLALGLGCARDADPAEAIDLALRTLAGHGLPEAAVAGVFSVSVKTDEPAVHAVAERLEVPARFFPPERLEAETARVPNPSEAVFREIGCHSVAEAAALAAAGASAALVAEKQKTRAVTCAAARAEAVIDADAIGQGRGRLTILGLGPGTRAWRTAEASAHLAEATDVVGYSAYLDLVAPEIARARLHPFALGEEERRAEEALELAAAGRRVALVSSGDAGIFGMAAAVFEILGRDGTAHRARPEIVVAPGISALQAAAARIGAPLGHDFCAISLSDLLTPWGVIKKRVEAAGAGDFVIAFYNPVSRRRRTQLTEARDILLRHRPPDTPVVLARDLGRPDESVTVTELAALAVEDADMRTLVLVGSSQTRWVGAGGARRWLLTPRGYAKGAGR